jgi:hypothetical protein
MACTHAAAMAVLSRIRGGHGGDRHVAMMAAAASKLLRTYAIQVEALRRLRNGSSSDFEQTPNPSSIIARLLRVMDVRQGALECWGFKILYLYNELAALR